MKELAPTPAEQLQEEIVHIQIAADSLGTTLAALQKALEEGHPIQAAFALRQTRKLGGLLQELGAFLEEIDPQPGRRHGPCVPIYRPHELDS